MHFWGLTIDTVSCINLVLAIGLCVDYAAHIAHTFMTKSGTRNERAAATISSIGPAVFHGGFSTFLAFIFLAGSDSHVFTTFFKVWNLYFFLFFVRFDGLYINPHLITEFCFRSLFLLWFMDSFTDSSFSLLYSALSVHHPFLWIILMVKCL